MSKSQRTPPLKPPCTYCGRKGETTRDHVVPQTMFVPPLPQMITVPAYKTCQAQKSWGEDDLRDYVNLDLFGEMHPNASHHLLKVLTSTSKGRSNIGRAMLMSGEARRWVTPNGIDTLRNAVFVDIPNENRDMIRTLEMMVRGLHCVRSTSETNHRFDRVIAPLPASCPVAIRGIDRLKAPDIVATFNRLPHWGPFVTGNDVCWWMRVPNADDETTNMWLLVFNDQVTFLGATGPQVMTVFKEPQPTLMFPHAEVERMLNKTVGG